MAMPPSHKIMSSKIDFLVEQRDSLQAVLDEIDKVIQLSDSCLGKDEEVNPFTFGEVNKMLEDKLVFLESGNCMGLSDDLKTVMNQVKKENEKIKTKQRTQKFRKDIKDVFKNIHEGMAQTSTLQIKTAITLHLLKGDAETMSIKHEEVDYVLKELTRTTEAASEDLSTRLMEHNSSLEQVKRRIDKMQKTEDKISALEKNLDESLCENKKLYNRLQKERDISGQTVTNSLGLLERASHIRNGIQDARKGNLKRHDMAGQTVSNSLGLLERARHIIDCIHDARKGNLKRIVTNSLGLLERASHIRNGIQDARKGNLKRHEMAGQTATNTLELLERASNILNGIQEARKGNLIEEGKF